MKKKKGLIQPKVNSEGVWLIHSDNVRNLMHFEVQLKNRMQVVESKKHKKPKYKKNYKDENSWDK